ncbi:MAG TPA: carboxylesterase family protein [Acidobacteriaceae bacterium]|nr:carboxylesterase family protein [Acidobacteriaceae bacterium]
MRFHLHPPRLTRPGTAIVAVAFIFLSAGSLRLQAQAAAPQAKIDSGTLQGAWVTSASHVAAFLGIPYAAQPVGNLRWRAPQPPPPWTGIREAIQYGPACPQTPSPWLPEMLGIQKMVTNEACLYLNVWTPNLRGAAKLPVMVWVHGGGNVEGSAEWPPLGATLAHEGVVVVSLNYRLGVFGFFAYPALAAESPHHVSGNYGHLDQVEALRWVKRNISRFGGDPNNVTVFGASSGALDICNLMASPIAAGLFQRAIMQSGVCVDSVYPVTRQAESNGELLAKDLGIETGPGSLAALRALPAEKLLLEAAKDNRIDLEPVVDGWFFPQQPATTFANGKQARIPVIVGSNNDEVSIFASPLVGGKSNRPKTVEAYRQWLHREFGSMADRVFAQYPATSDKDVPAVFRTMDTDFDFGFGARLLAIEMAQIHQPAYLYHFTYAGAGAFAALGAFHSEESMFLSKKYWTTWVRQPYDKTLSNAIIGYWVQFAKKGDPNTSALPAWPVYQTTTDLCQELGRRIGAERVPRAERFAVFQQFLDSRLAKSSK